MPQEFRYRGQVQIENVIKSKAMHAHGKNETDFGSLANSPVVTRAIWLRSLEPCRNGRGDPMYTVALFVRLEAKPGKQGDVATFLETGLALANQEAATPVWFALRLGPTTFGVFDAFTDERGREAHLTGPIARALMAKAPELLASPPAIERIDVLGAKVPQTRG
jgi:quinol monooxygenase YgiN